MLKSKLTRTISMIMVFALLLTTFSGCVGKNDPNWKIKDDEEIIRLNVSLSTEGEKQTLVLTHEDDIFSEEINKDTIKVSSFTPAPLNDDVSKEKSQKDDFGKTKEIKKPSITRNSAKSITLTFDDKAEENVIYYVSGSRKATISKKLCKGTTNNTTDEPTKNYSALIEGKFTTATKDPTITIKLKDTVAAEKTDASQFTLSEAFEKLTIKSVAGNGDTITITTVGEISPNSTSNGCVTLAAAATDCGNELAATAEVTLVGAWIDEASYVYENGKLRFNIVLSEMEFTLPADQLASKISIEDAKVQVTSISENKKSTSISLTIKAKDVNEALKSIRGKTIKIAKEATVAEKELSLAVTAGEAYLGAVIDNVSKKENNNYEGTAFLYAHNGTFEELKAEDIKFSGDFTEAKTNSISKGDDGTYILKFAFSKEEVNLDDCSLSGIVSITDSKLKNKWKTVSANISAPFNYVTGGARGENWDAVKAFVKANEATFGTISTVGSAVSGVVGVATGVQTILEMCGVLESTNDKLDAIRNVLDDIKGQMSEMNNKIDRMGNNLSAQLDTVISQNDKTIYNTSSNNWNNFLSSYVTPLTNVINSYNIEYNNAMLNYIYNADTMKITVYIDKNGKVTSPNPNSSKYAVDGTEIVSSNQYTTKKQLGKALPHVNANGGRLYSNYMKDIEIELKFAGQLDKSLVSPEDYIAALKLQMASEALKKVGASNILNAYTNFCYATTGSISGSPVSSSTTKPLSYYQQMLSVFYNFYSEAKNDMENMNSWLGVLLTQSSALATMASNFTPGYNPSTIKNAYKSAATEITGNIETHDLPKGQDYCYIAKRNLKIGQVDYSTNYNGSFLVDTTNSQEYEFKFSVMSQASIVNMQNRYKMLKQAGVTSAESFGKYLVSVGLIDSSLAETKYVITEKVRRGTLPLDNSYTLPCIFVQSGKWFKVGTSYSMGAHGKLDKDEFCSTRLIAGNCYNIQDGSTRPYLRAYAWYNEYFVFLSSEIAEFEDRLPGPFLVFELR